LCCLHHPKYKYTNAPDKKNNPATHLSFPPKEVFPAASPADSSMTGAAAIATPVKRKRTLKAAPREESRIKKGATAGTGQKNQMEAVKEGTADDANLKQKEAPRIYSENEEDAVRFQSK
jgi:hypothetical protein